MELNQNVVDSREAVLKKTMAFRAPISTNRTFRRGFRASYGPVEKVTSIHKNIVKAANGQTYSLKQIKPVAT